MEGLLDAEVVEEDTGEMKVMGVFRTEKTAIIAGGEVLDGRVSAGMRARVIRRKQYLGEVEVDSVQKEKIDAKELVAGEIGGLALKTEKKIVMEVGDRLKLFTREMVKKKL